MSITWLDRFRCWLFGHKRTLTTFDDPGYVYCRRCGVFIEYLKPPRG